MEKEYYFLDKAVIIKEVYEVFQLVCIVMADTNEERIVDMHLIKTYPYIENTISLSVLLGRIQNDT